MINRNIHVQLRIQWWVFLIMTKIKKLYSENIFSFVQLFLNKFLKWRKSSNEIVGNSITDAWKKLKTFKNLKTMLYITFFIFSFIFLLEFEKKLNFLLFCPFFFDQSSHFLQFEKCTNQMYAKEYPINLPLETTKVTLEIVVVFWWNKNGFFCWVCNRCIDNHSIFLLSENFSDEKH